MRMTARLIAAAVVFALCTGTAAAKMNDCTIKHRQVYASKAAAQTACNALNNSFGRGDCGSAAGWWRRAYSNCPSGYVSARSVEWPTPEFQESGFGQCPNRGNDYTAEGQETIFEYCTWDSECPTGYSIDPLTPEDKSCKLPQYHITPATEPEPEPQPEPVTNGVEIGFGGLDAPYVENVDIDTGEGPFVPAVYDPISGTWKASHVSPAAVYIDGRVHPDATNPDGTHRLTIDVQIDGQSANDTKVILRKTEINGSNEIDDIMSLQPEGEVIIEPNPADDGEYELGIFENATLKEAYEQMKRRETDALAQ